MLRLELILALLSVDTVHTVELMSRETKTTALGRTCTSRLFGGLPSPRETKAFRQPVVKMKVAPSEVLLPLGGQVRSSEERSEELRRSRRAGWILPYITTNASVRTEPYLSILYFLAPRFAHCVCFLVADPASPQTHINVPPFTKYNRNFTRPQPQECRHASTSEVYSG